MNDIEKWTIDELFMWLPKSGCNEHDAAFAEIRRRLIEAASNERQVRAVRIWARCRSLIDARGIGDSLLVVMDAAAKEVEGIK